MNRSEMIHMLRLSNGKRVAAGLMRLFKNSAKPARPEDVEALRSLKGEIMLCFRSRAKYLCIVRSLVASLCADTPFCDSDIDDLTLAVGEAVANALRHGSPRGSEDAIAVCCRVNDIGVTVEIRDQGRGIGNTRTRSNRLGQLSVGGYGIPLMRRLSDFMRIDSGQNGTTVTISKYFPVSIGQA